MKKRLLSAALALAMVLTMLPLSVMPASAATTEPPTANTGVTQISWTTPTTSMNLAYYNAGAQLQGHTIKSPGWYAVASSTAGGTTTYTGYVVYKEGNTTGMITGINGGTWYPNLDAAITAKASNLVLTGDSTTSASLTPNNVSSLTIDLNGHTLSGTITIPATYMPAGASAAQNNGFSQLTIKDSTKSGSAYNESNSGPAITVGNGTAKATSTTITLNNVKVGGITAKYTTACTVNVYGSETGAISLTGTSGGQINLGNGSTKGKATTVSLTTDGTAQGGTITATDAETQGITLSGVGASLTGTNLKVTGGITLFGLTKVDNDNQKSTLNTPTVTLNGGTVSSGITKGPSTEVLSKNYSVTLNTNAKVNGITLDNANVTVNNSAAGVITVNNGDVKLNGSATGPASAGVITLGKDKAAASLTVTGTNVTTGNITAAAGTVNITVPESETNNFGTLTSTVPVANRGINGGVWGSEVPIENLNTNLRYQTFKKDGTRYRYYSDTQFQNVLDAYHVGPDTTVITLVKDSAKKKDNTITFKDGDDVVAILSYGTANLPFVLPSAINGRTVLKWSEYKGSDLLSEPAPGTTYSTPSTPDNRVLNAQATDTTITKLAGVTSGVNGVTARLDGNVITLSGAVNANNTSIIVTVTTDGDPNQTATIVIIYDNGKVYFANQNASLPSAMRISNDSSTLIIGNGTASYTLNGSGLRGLAKGLEGKVHGYKSTTLPVLVTVNCSGTGWTNVRKTELGNYMSNDVGTASNAFAADETIVLTETSGGSSVDFSDSPAVKEALNAAVAGITQSQIDSWILNAQNTAWRKNNTTNPTATDRASTGYSEVHVVAYMAVNITNYNTANKPGTMTMTLTPSYYVEVTGDNGTKVTDPKFELDTSKSNELNALRPVNNRSLGSLTGEMGTIKLTLKTEEAFDLTVDPVAHQGGTYAYPKGFEKTRAAGTMTFNITHAINGALGQFVVDGQKPMVTRYDKKGADKAAQAHYDTLQAAVDDAKNGEYIEVDANYKGGCNITVTGTARKFTINTNGANKVTSNVSGVVTELPGGNEYQVQLVKDTLTPSGNVAITVVSVANGYARVSASSVKPGSVVTITTVPNVGYAATTPSVRYSTKTVASNVLGVTAVGTNTWSFTVPADATGVTVTPGFVLIGGTTVPFTDVAATAWYYGGVEYCYNTVRGSNRLMEGLSTTTFGPTRPFTRAEVVTILWNMKGRPSSGYTNRTYTDVGTNHWAYNAIVWATNNGYAEGYPGGAFRPSQSVTREEMVVFLWRAAGKPTGYSSTNLNAYTDGYNVHDWAQNAMRWALGYGVLSGQNSVGLGGTIAPRAVAYRSEVAVTVMNFDKLALFR